MRKILVWIIIAVVIGSILIGGIGNTTQKEKVSITRGYTTHGPIYIDSDSEFDSKHGVVGGSGTPGDPYIISGWDIDASGYNNVHAAITIKGTSAFFVIKYCYIHDSGVFGIELNKVSHATISNNQISDNKNDGIYLGESNGNTIEDNIISSNGRYAIEAMQSYGNTITSNDFIDNHEKPQAFDFPDFTGYNNWNGNYWSDYSGGGRYTIDSEMEYHIHDNHPLTSPVNPTVEPPEENSVAGIPLSYLIIAVVLIAVVIIAVVLIAKRKK